MTIAKPTARKARLNQPACMLPALALCALLGLFAQAAWAEERKPVLPGWNGMIAGAYVWDGLPSPEVRQNRPPVAVAADILAAKGVKGIRLIVNLQQFKPFEIKTERCAPRPQVDCYLGDPDFRAAIDNPAFDVVAITLHETALSGWKMADPTAMRSLEAISRREVRNFLTALLPLMQKNPKKTIIITNREGDHSIYCGSTAKFIDNAGFRTECMGPTVAGRSGALDGRRDALILWYQGRQREIEDFRKAHTLGNRLLHAVEFNTVHRVVDFEKKLGLDFPQTLFDIVPQIKPDLCSSSAYSSFNNGYSFVDDLETIKQQCKGAPIILGELGFSSKSRNEEAIAQRYRKAFAEAKASGVRAIFVWQGFESQAAGKEYGLFRRDGTDFQWRYLKALF